MPLISLWYCSVSLFGGTQQASSDSRCLPFELTPSVKKRFVPGIKHIGSYPDEKQAPFTFKRRG